MNEFMQTRITGQIAVHRTDKKLLEFIENLNPAPIQDYAAIHAGAVRPYEVNGKRVHSIIRLVAQDYSRKDIPSKRVKANIAPEDALYLASIARAGVKDFKFESIKIFGNPDAFGLCPMTKLWVNRRDVTANGEALINPWNVTIENGKGIKAQNKSGGSFCQGGSYVLEKRVFMHFTDYEFFKLICAVERFIQAWEIAHGVTLVKEGRHARDTQFSPDTF